MGIKFGKSSAWVEETPRRAWNSQLLENLPTSTYQLNRFQTISSNNIGPGFDSKHSPIFQRVFDVAELIDSNGTA